MQTHHSQSDHPVQSSAEQGSRTPLIGTSQPTAAAEASALRWRIRGFRLALGLRVSGLGRTWCSKIPEARNTGIETSETAALECLEILRRGSVMGGDWAKNLRIYTQSPGG